MGLLIAPLSRNHLSAATLLTSAITFQRGFPGANAWDADFRRPAILRGRMVVTAGVNDRIDGNDGALFAATLTAGAYASVAEWCVMVAARLNAVSTNWTAYQLHGATNRYRAVVARTAGTSTLLNGTGANAATSGLVFGGGFGPYDRAAAGSHVGDLAVTHYPSDIIEADLGSALVGECSFVALPGLSQAGLVAVSTGSTTPVSAAGDLATTYADDSFDSEVMLIRPSSPVAARYVALSLLDPRREDSSRASVGYWWHGVPFDPDRSSIESRLNFEPMTWSSQIAVRATFPRSVAGHVHVAEAEVGESFSVSFNDFPGYGPEGSPSLRALINDLGRSGLAFVAVDPDTEPHRETRLCRFTGPPTIEQRAIQSAEGRWRVSLDFAVVRGLR